MGKKTEIAKRQHYSKREEEKANRLFKGICIGLILLALDFCRLCSGIAPRDRNGWTMVPPKGFSVPNACFCIG